MVRYRIKKSPILDRSLLNYLISFQKWAAHWYDVEDRIAAKNLKRRLFVATDDPGIFADLHSKWGQIWEIISFQNNSNGLQKT
jgi:hypothetical protein